MPKSEKRRGRRALPLVGSESRRTKPEDFLRQQTGDDQPMDERACAIIA